MRILLLTICVLLSPELVANSSIGCEFIQAILVFTHPFATLVGERIRCWMTMASSLWNPLDADIGSDGEDCATDDQSAAGLGAD